MARETYHLSLPYPTNTVCLDRTGRCPIGQPGKPKKNFVKSGILNIYCRLTLYPASQSVSANCVLTVDFPTPPLTDFTRITCFTLFIVRRFNFSPPELLFSWIWMTLCGADMNWLCGLTSVHLSTHDASISVVWPGHLVAIAVNVAELRRKCAGYQHHKLMIIRGFVKKIIIANPQLNKIIGMKSAKLIAKGERSSRWRMPTRNPIDVERFGSCVINLFVIRKWWAIKLIAIE